MKKRRISGIFIVICLLLEGCGVFLAEYIPQRAANNSVEVPAFSLIYLDGDDVPELVVIEGYAHACGGYVYTFEEELEKLILMQEEVWKSLLD